MRSRGTKRRPGAAEWASCLRVDSALTAWLQTVYSGRRVAQAPFGAAERGFCQAAQGCATWIINCKCFRKAHTCKGHRSQHFFPLALFTEPIEATERGIPNVVLFGSFRDLILHVLPCLPSDSGASQRYSEVAKLELQLQDQLPNAKASMFNWRLKYIELLSQGSINPKFNPIWSYLMYYHVLYDIYIIYILFIIQYVFHVHFQYWIANKLLDLTSGSVFHVGAWDVQSYQSEDRLSGLLAYTRGKS